MPAASAHLLDQIHDFADLTFALLLGRHDAAPGTGTGSRSSATPRTRRARSSVRGATWPSATRRRSPTPSTKSGPSPPRSTTVTSASRRDHLALLPACHPLAHCAVLPERPGLARRPARPGDGTGVAPLVRAPRDGAEHGGDEDRAALRVEGDADAATVKRAAPLCRVISAVQPSSHRMRASS